MVSYYFCKCHHVADPGEVNLTCRTISGYEIGTRGLQGLSRELEYLQPQ